MFGAWGNSDQDESIRIIHKALEAGINFIDTADIYANGESEEIVGKALKGQRDSVVLATKCFMPMGESPLFRGSSRRWIVKAVEDSLRRLDTEWIDLFQLHRPDPSTDIDESLGALSDLIHQGKIRAAGHTTFPATEILEAHWVAKERNREFFSTNQPPYSILVRAIEREVLPTCERLSLGVLPWSPLAGGWLSGRVKDGTEATTSRMWRVPLRYDLTLPGNQAKLEAVKKLDVVAEEAGLSLIHLAIGFVLSHPAVTSPIIGPRTMEQFDSQIGAAEVKLSADVLDAIDAIVPPGVTLHGPDNGYDPPSITDPKKRRRSV